VAVINQKWRYMYDFSTPELCEKRCQTPSPPAVKTILKIKYHSYNKWTRVRLHQDPYLKTEKLKREPIPNPIIETTREREPFNKSEKLEPEFEINSQPLHSKYIHNVLKRRLSHVSSFGVFQGDTNGTLKSGVQVSNITLYTCL